MPPLARRIRATMLRSAVSPARRRLYISSDEALIVRVDELEKRPADESGERDLDDPRRGRVGHLDHAVLER